MHKKRVSGKDYFYTTLRKGEDTKSVYLGGVYKEAIIKEKELKNKLPSKFVYKNSKLIDMIVIVLMLLAAAFMLKLPFTGFIVYEPGNIGVDINMFVSQNSSFVLDDVDIGMPFELVEYNGSLGYNVTTLSLNLNEGEHILNLIDNGLVVFNKVINVSLVNEPIIPFGVNLPVEDISLPVQHVILPAQVVTKNYITPKVNVKDKLNKKGVYDLKKRGDKFDLDAEINGNKINIKGLKTTKDIDIIVDKFDFGSSDFIYTDIDEIELAEIRVKRHDISSSGITVGRKQVLVCNNFSVNNLECDGWSSAGVDAYDEGDYYIFNISHFSAYLVGSSLNYTDISQCLFYNNNSADTCQLNDANTIYNMSGSTVWLEDADLYNKTGMIFGFNNTNYSQVYDKDSSCIIGYSFIERDSRVAYNKCYPDYNGTIFNATALNYGGLYDNSPLFDTGSYIQVNNTQIINFSNTSYTNFNIGFWISIDPGTTSASKLITKGKEDSATYPFYIEILNDFTINASIKNSTTLNSYIGCNTGDGRWHYFVFQRNTTNEEIYCDGDFVAKGTALAGRFDNTNELLIAGNTSSRTYSDGYYGNLDEIVILNRTMSSEEIKAIYQRVYTTDISGMNQSYYIRGAMNNTRTLNANSITTGFSSNVNSKSFLNITSSGSNSDFNVSQNFTFEAWINPGTIQNRIILDRNNQLRISVLASGLVRFITTNASGTNINNCDSIQALSVNKWQHLAVTLNSTEKVIYLNGNVDKSCLWIGGVKHSIKAMIIGANNNGAGNINASMDNIAIYNRTLTASEIATHAWGHYNNYKFSNDAIGFVTETENQTLDCAGKTLQGSYTSIGINIPNDASGDNSGNHTILNCNLDWFNTGISSKSRDLTIKNTIIKNSVAENIMISTSDTDPEYRVYIENVTLTNSSTEDNIQANPNGLTNLTIINMNASYSQKTCASIDSDYYKIINSYFYNSNTDNCVTLAGNTIGSLFANNTLKYNRADDKFTLYVTSTSSLLIENNTFEENNLNLVSVGKNWIARNNTLNTTYELNYAGTGLSGNILLGGNSDNNQIIGNHIYNSAFNGIILSSVGGTPPTNNTITNNSIYNTSSGWDLRITSVDVYNTSIYLNNFYSKGVNNGSVDISNSDSNFCVSNEGNFYEENIGDYTNITYKGYNDCGQSNLSTPKAGDTISGEYNISWRKQSSFNDINYTLQIRNSNNVWSNITTTDKLSFLLGANSYANGSYLLRIIPFDNYKRATNYTLTNTIELNTVSAAVSAGGGGGGGGGSSGGAPRIYTTLFNVDRQQIKTMLSPDEIITEKITIQSEVPNSIYIAIDTDENLKGLVEISEKTFNLGPNESKIISLIIKAYDGVGMYLGSLILKSGESTKKIPFVMNVQSKERQIDATFYINPQYSKVNPGKEIVANVNLFSIGDQKSTEANIRYFIKDMTGYSIKEEYENITLNNQVSFNKIISLPDNIKPGTYVLGIEILHKNLISIASEIFEVVPEIITKKTPINGLILFSAISALFIVVLIVTIKLIKRKI